MHGTPESPPFQFFLIRKILKPLDEIFIIHDVIDGNIGKVPVVVIVCFNCFFRVLNACLFTCFCIHFGFLTVFIYFPGFPGGLVSRNVELHDRAAQYIVIIESKFSPNQASADGSKFSRPAGSLWNDDVVFPIAPRYCIDLIPVISRQKQLGINRHIQFHSGRGHFFIFSCNFIRIVIKF